MRKLVTKTEYLQIKNKIKAEGKKVVLCHGVFDLVHPGHILHFEQAKKMGDILVVSITAERYVRKGPGRPYFDDEMRLKFLEAIQYIDYVMLSEGPTVDDIVEIVEPDIYVKGEEYRKAYNDITGAITAEQKLVEKHGGRIAFTDGPKFSSTKLINNVFRGLPDEVRAYVTEFGQKYLMDDIRAYSEKTESLKVLVVGETIVDQYTYCFIQGVSNKDRVYSAKAQRTEEYWGGALATAMHMAEFTPNVTFLSVIGNCKETLNKVKDDLSNELTLELVSSEWYPTIKKQYFLTKDEKREEYRKVFAVSNLPEILEYGEKEKEELLQKLNTIIEEFDMVVVCDYGYGLLDRKLIDVLEQRAKCLAVKCFTDSSNMKPNLITKYKRVDYFLLDSSELNLIYTDYYETEKQKLKELSETLQAIGWVTRGSNGAYGIDLKGIYDCPAFTLVVKDTMGAENAFFAAACLFSAAGAPIEMGTFIGNVAGALSTNIVGNSKEISKIDILRFASTLLNI